MIHPSLPEFKRLAKSHTVVPLWVECLSDQVTPLSLFRTMYAQSPACFLLESVEGGEHLGRYSFAAFEPQVLFRGRGDRVVLQRGRHEDVRTGVDPLEELRRLMAGRRAPEVRGLPRFYGGAVGAFGYDVVRRFERLPDTTKDVLNFPDALFMLTGDMFIFDHVAHTIKIVRNVPVAKGASVEAGYRSAARDLMRMVRALRPAPTPLEPFVLPARETPPFTAADRRSYMDAVRKAKEYIAAGDIIQVVPSRRVTMKTKAHPLAIYRSLRRVNPSPYMFFLRDGDTHVIGSSPEMQVRLENGVAETHPIAGTRPRGETPEADERLAKEMSADPKERAEHVMLVDLARNDLGRVCDPGTVKAEDFMSVKRYSHVMHLESTVKGRLSSGKDALDLFRATFPAGTLSGAPKVRAMQIIEELETSRRGLYGGAVGYLSYTGNMDMAIAIRTLLMKGKTAHLQAGAGIVADSVPETEFEETQNKLAAVVTALRAAEGRS
jgi:anthranilate synthase component 1